MGGPAPQTVVAGQRRAHEAAGFGDVAAAGPAMAAQEPVESDLQFAGAVIAEPGRAVVKGADVQVVLQVATDPGQIGLHGEALCAQVRGRPDAREHQQLR